MNAQSQNDYFVGEANLYFELNSLSDKPTKYVGLWRFPNDTFIMIRSTNNTLLKLDTKYDICYSDDEIEMIFSPRSYEGILRFMSFPKLAEAGEKCDKKDNIDILGNPVEAIKKFQSSITDTSGVLSRITRHTPGVLSRSFTPVNYNDPIASDPVLSNLKTRHFGKHLRDKVKTSRKEAYVRYTIDKNEVIPFHVLLTCKKETDGDRVWKSRFLNFDELEYKSFFTISTKIFNYIGDY